MNLPSSLLLADCWSLSCQPSLREPSRQIAVLCLSLQLLLRHLLEEFARVNVFASVNPLASRVDLGVGLNRCDDSRGTHL
jgi:hypothetical protein